MYITLKCLLCQKYYEVLMKIIGFVIDAFRLLKILKIIMGINRRI